MNARKKISSPRASESASMEMTFIQLNCHKAHLAKFQKLAYIHKYYEGIYKVKIDMLKLP